MFEEIRIHKGYVEWEEAKERGIDIPQMFGKYQHIFSSEKGVISLILLKNYSLFDKQDFWEIYCLEGNLFEDTERFDTKEEAIKRIKEFLE
jgi:hypothetical protein